jgi:hypothetical protein
MSVKAGCTAEAFIFRDEVWSCGHELGFSRLTVDAGLVVQLSIFPQE